MLSEEFDKKIREAADHHHPTYDEKAWGRMKKLLDKHLPEEKDDKRRYFFFLLLFLLLGGGAWLFFGQGIGNRNKEATAARQTTVETNQQQPAGIDNSPGTISKTEAPKPAEKKTEDGEENNNEVTIVNADEPERAIANKPAVNTVPGKTNLAGKTPPLTKQHAGKQPKTTKPSSTSVIPVAENTKVEKGDPPVTKAETKPAVVPTEPVLPVDEGKAGKETRLNDPSTVTVPVGNNKSNEKMLAPVPIVKTEEKKADEKPVKRKPIPVSAKKSSFFVAVSAGPDVSFTGNDKPGRMQLLGGAGIGYTFKEKFTLRTGFYSARKTYTSSPDEYNPPDIFYTYYPNLQKVEADCKVYEIPLLLSYHFGRKSNQSWFATAGVSTLIMKRETYDYYYKNTPTGPTVNREYTMNNENKHFFSVATLSAGYQRSLSKRVAVSAEPYFKLPLSGVGYGKVKLNSAGVLFSLSVRPFQKAEKK